MKVPRSHIGKRVEITWRDPMSTGRVKEATAPKGWDALATWVEEGTIDDITNGIVRLRHSRGENPPFAPDREFEIMPTYIVEALISKIVTYRQDETVPVLEEKN